MIDDAVAIVGMACRYPDADSPMMLFENVMARRRAFRPIPPERLGPAYFGDSTDTTYLETAAVLTGWEFPRGDFGVSLDNHNSVDHVHWLALQVASEALIDAGLPAGGDLDRKRIGAIVGNSLTGEFSRAASLRLRAPFLTERLAEVLQRRGVEPDLALDLVADYGDEIRSHFPAPDDNSLAGALANTIAGRICNHFDFSGLGYTVDGACASSLLSVQLASESLLNGRLDLALAGGVDLSLDPFELVGFSRLGALARGEMRVYDAEPTGFLPGEGCGMVALMRHQDALDQGRRIYARIDGWGISSDGSGGLTRPASGGQMLAYERAFDMAGWDPAETELIEGHGTGTAVGDQVELEVFSALWADAPRPARVGSVKANIGHTKAAAGTAGLIKAAMAVHAGVRPPNTGCQQRPDHLDGGRSVLDTGLDPLPFEYEERRASVAALGFGGINCVLAVSQEHHDRGPSWLPTTWSPPSVEGELLVVGAPSRAALLDQLREMARICARLSAGELADLAAGQIAAGAHHSLFRSACVISEPGETAVLNRAIEMVGEWDGKTLTIDRAADVALGSGPPSRIGLLFPGQASPVRPRRPRWAAELCPDLSLPTSIADGIGQGRRDTEHAQPAIVFQSLLGLGWLERLHCRPSLAIGHSLGEICALVHAGRLTSPEAMNLAVERGRLMQEYGRPNTTMAVVATDPDTTEVLLEGTDVTVAGYNAVGQTTIAGPEERVEAVLRAASERDIRVVSLDVSHGFHSEAMRPVQEPFAAVLRGLGPRSPVSTFVSTVSGAIVDRHDRYEVPKRLLDQLIEPVRFVDAVRASSSEVDVFVEVGPGSVLTGLVRDSGFEGPVVAMDVSGDAIQLVRTAALLVAGAACDAAQWFADRPWRPFDPERSGRVLASPCEIRPDQANLGTASVRPTVDTGVEPRGCEPVEAETSEDHDTLTRLRRHLARLMQLEVEHVQPEASLLADLHFTSLQVVDMAEAMIRAADKAPPSVPLMVATATVAELAAFIDELPPAEDVEDDSVVGVASWVRAFEHLWEDVDAVDLEVSDVPGATRWLDWDGSTAVDSPVAGSVLGPPDAAGDDGVACGVVLRIDADANVEQLVGALRFGASTSAGKIVVTGQHPAMRAVARSLAAEGVTAGVTVVDVGEQAWDRRRRSILEIAASRGYTELRTDGDGRLQRLRTRPATIVPTAPVTFEPGDVCLVTGGLEGITIECAIDLARRTGLEIVAVGRTPADDSKIVTAMERLPADVSVEYRQCDLTNARSVAEVCGPSTDLHPRLRALLHGAAVNQARPIASTTGESLDVHVGPKVRGFQNLLDVCGDRLRLITSFGSIIGRCGLAGQAEYSVANEWLTQVAEQWAAQNPECRVRNIEWSVWSGTGMGVRMGVIDRLERTGVSAIPPQSGIDIFRRLIDCPDVAVTTTVAGRFPFEERLWLAGHDRPLLDRFQENAALFTPGVELVTRPTVGVATDPYLVDHRVDGMPVLPAVVGLEAMAQGFAGCVGDDDEASYWEFEDVELPGAVLVQDDSVELQVATLIEDQPGPKRAFSVLRSSADRFASTRFKAEVTRPATPDALDVADQTTGRVGFGDDSSEALPVDQLYGSLFFHGPAFEAVKDIRYLSAYRVDAIIEEPDEQQQWFGAFHSQRLRLGSPALLDAGIHVLLATLPEEQALPLGAKRVSVLRPLRGTLQVEAEQTAFDGSDYLFDLRMFDLDDQPVCAWSQLRIRPIRPRPVPEAGLPIVALGPWLSRRLERENGGNAIDIAVRGSGTAASTRFEPNRSRSRLDQFSLAAEATVPVGVDWQNGAVPPSESHLGRGGVALCDTISNRAEFDESTAARMAWTVREALVKIGADPDTPFEVSRSENAAVMLATRGLSVLSTAVDVAEIGPVAASVAYER